VIKIEKKETKWALAAQREIGIVKWFDSAKGYGFIRLSGGLPSRNDGIFCHQSQVAAKDENAQIVPFRGYRTLAEDGVLNLKSHRPTAFRSTSRRSGHRTHRKVTPRIKAGASSFKGWSEEKNSPKMIPNKVFSE
jgi:cold shock CspA family protein